MNDGPPIEDYRAFGQLVRQRRRALGLSQEALASDALGNPDRKSYVSAIENTRLQTITPSTAQKLSGPLGLTLEDVPASLRWPVPNAPSPIEERLSALEAQRAAGGQAPDDTAITLFLNRHMAAVLDRSMSEVFRTRLIAGIDVLRTWTGAPFSFQSLMTCYALSMIYLVIAGAVSFLQGDITVGSIRPFHNHIFGRSDFAPVIAYIGVAVLLLAASACVRLVLPFGMRPLTEGQTAARLGGTALIAGIACGFADYLGTQTMMAAALFSVPCVAAISTLRPTRAALYGAAGGVAFGTMAAVSSGLSDDGLVAFLKSLSEGFIIGAIVGGCAGLVSSLIAGKFAYLRPGQLAAAGGGTGFGAAASLVGILVADEFSAISDGMVGLFALSWVALPVANAALDYVSLGVSHTIGRYVARHRMRMTALVLFMLLDLALAVVFMIATVVFVGVALQSISWGLGIETTSDAFLADSAADPWGRGLWLTAMALTTVLWTLLHFGVVVAPLAAGALTRATVERAAAERLGFSTRNSEFDASIGVLVTLRVVLFYGSWIAIAVSPVLLLAGFPQLMETLLWLGASLAALIV